MSIENIGLQEITIVAGKEIPNQVAVQGDNAARGLSIKLLGSNNKIINDPLIQIFWNYEIVTDDGVYTLDEPVEGRYSAGRYEVEYPSQLGAMSGIALAQVQFKQGLKTLYSIPYKIRVYKQVGQVGSSIPPGVVNIFDKALADALEELTQMSKDTKEYMVQTTSDVEAAFKSEMQLIFDGLESDVSELESLIVTWETESTEYLNNLKAEGDKAVADLHIQLDETAEQLINELRADLKIEYDKKQAEIDSITDDLVLQKAELENLQERITTNTNTIEQLTVDFESKINQHITDSDDKIDNHLSLYETKFTEYATQSTRKIDQAIADMAGALDEDIERIVSEKVDEFADGLSERVTKAESDIITLESKKASKSYVDEQIANNPGIEISHEDIPIDERRENNIYFIIDDFREIGTGYPGNIVTGNLRLSRRDDI